MSTKVKRKDHTTCEDDAHQVVTALHTGPVCACAACQERARLAVCQQLSCADPGRVDGTVARWGKRRAAYY